MNEKKAPEMNEKNALEMNEKNAETPVRFVNYRQRVGKQELWVLKLRTVPIVPCTVGKLAVYPVVFKKRAL